jgi:hypothetical protein
MPVLIRKSSYGSNRDGATPLFQAVAVLERTIKVISGLVVCILVVAGIQRAGSLKGARICGGKVFVCLGGEGRSELKSIVGIRVILDKHIGPVVQVIIMAGSV